MSKSIIVGLSIVVSIFILLSLYTGEGGQQQVLPDAHSVPFGFFGLVYLVGGIVTYWNVNRQD